MTRFARLRTRLPALLALLPCVASGCGLSPIEPFVCGNGVVEPENHEDCDRDSSSCGSKLAAAPCRYLCASDADCLPAYGCGTDGVCRRPTLWRLRYLQETQWRPYAELAGLPEKKAALYNYERRSKVFEKELKS